ncbi:MAG: type II secretion system protein GspM [Gemmatimonadota bacterium]|nr:type II secretion system protein GspM [Gemmatimonadota bacterium]
MASTLIPLSNRWRDRERAISEKRDELAEVEWLVGHRGDASEAPGASASKNELLFGRTAAVAASTLQGIVQRYADENGLTLNRLDIADLPAASSGSFPLIPCSVSAVGDIYGLTEFLFALQRGRPLVDIREMSIVSSSALGEGVLQISLNLSAPAAIEQ